MKLPAPGSPVVPPQFGLINLLKAIAAQLIVLHHLAIYGPMSTLARELLPQTLEWLEDWGRIAVQVFLVIGGFLAAKSLSDPAGRSLSAPARTIWRRYIKLVPPFLVAMLLAIAANAIARVWMVDDAISAPATLPQLAAHGLLLHSVLEYESLSAGVWYVAIDFQLYALLVALLWIVGRLARHDAGRWLLPIVITACSCASLFYFNRDRDWDVWAAYFFGSYSLGIMAWWASDTQSSRGRTVVLVLMMAIPLLFALAIDFRIRLVVAAAAACVLFLFGRARIEVAKYPVFALFNELGRISYAIFLVHFPVCLVVNAAFTRFVPLEPGWQLAGMGTAWGASLLAGAAFFYWVEIPLGRLFSGAASNRTTARNPKMTISGPLSLSR